MRGSVAAVPIAALIVVACGSGSLPPVLGESAGDDAGGAGTDAVANGDVPSLGPTPAPSDDPLTCEQAAAWQSYVGCDYWPTVVANAVWSIFDYAVVVANAGMEPAQVTVTGPGGVDQTKTVAPDSLGEFFLPWVPALKGADADSCGTPTPLSSSVLVTGGAYHLVSTVPVTVYQFNALEYAGKGGPAGKDWSACPGNDACTNPNSPDYQRTVGCYSFTNDSSLLLPSTALTGNYRITGFPGETVMTSPTTSQAIMGSYVAITATANATHVKVKLTPSGNILAGSGIAATATGGELDLTMNAGDVAQLVGSLGNTFDQSGSLVVADNPVQVIAGTPCQDVPDGQPACDHLEQSVFPAETLGQQYFVNMPMGPLSLPVAHVVRLYGNVDGTTLTYAPSQPPGCPSTIDAGQVVGCGIVYGDFEVTGNNAFGVATFMLGGTIVDPSGGLGDPSESLVASVEQYRTKYVFLAPNDYVENYVDVVAPAGTVVFLDGAPARWLLHTAIADGYSVWRAQLSASGDGAHTVESSAPVGMQVLGYGEYTSYQYPAGLNLKHIAPAPGSTQ
jgi:hypothetical protein